MKRKRTVKRLISYLEAWVDRPRNKEDLYDNAKLLLNNYLKGEMSSPLAILSRVAWWLGNHGDHLVLNNDPRGWNEIGRSLHYLAWDERTLFAELENKQAKGVQIIRSIFTILHAICANQDHIADWFGKRLISSLQQKDTRFHGWDTPLYTFTIQLFAIWRNISLDISKFDVFPLEIYQDVLDTWENDDRFGKVLTDACEYHVYQAFDDSEEDTQDFCQPLYDLFPVEILAIKRIRAEQGLSMPEIDHPLMQTPLATPPEPMPCEADDLLKKVSEKVCKDYHISDPWKI